jgi:hypothetical protein
MARFRLPFAVLIGSVIAILLLPYPKGGDPKGHPPFGCLEGLDFQGRGFEKAFEEFCFSEYKNIPFEELGMRSFTFIDSNYSYDVKFKMDMDTMLYFHDSLAVLFFNGAKSDQVPFSCHACYPPYALVLFKQNANVFTPLAITTEVNGLLMPSSTTPSLQLIFEDQYWPGPQLLLHSTDGTNGHFYSNLTSVDLNPYTFGVQRLLFSQDIKNNRTFFPDADQQFLPNNYSWKDGTQEVYKMLDRSFELITDKSDLSIVMPRVTHNYWLEWNGGEFLDTIENTHTITIDTLYFQYEGTGYAPSSKRKSLN